jgi:hypothetical protein
MGGGKTTQITLLRRLGYVVFDDDIVYDGPGAADLLKLRPAPGSTSGWSPFNRERNRRLAKAMDDAHRVHVPHFIFGHSKDELAVLIPFLKVVHPVLLIGDRDVHAARVRARSLRHGKSRAEANSDAAYAIDNWNYIQEDGVFRDWPKVNAGGSRKEVTDTLIRRRDPIGWRPDHDIL